MAVKIRLARGGSKKRPYYRIVVADIRAPRDGRYIERVGSYNPLLPKDHEDRVKLDIDRIKEWLSKGAKPTDRVARFLDAEGILKREPRNNPQKAIPKKEPEEAPAEEAPAYEEEQKDEKYKSIYNTDLYFKMLKTLQEAQTKIETLETEMTALKARVKTLEDA